MIVYSDTKAGFCADVKANRIAGRVESAVRTRLGRRTPRSELDSWRSSLQYMHVAIADSAVPDDAGVAIEYRIPASSKRIDFLVTGQSDAGEDSVVIGGYGLSKDELPELKAQFRGALARRPDMDFLEEFQRGRRSSIERHFVHFVICAFFMELAVEAGGLEMAMELLHTGERGEDLMPALGKTLGIDEAGFHRAVVEIIQQG